MMPLSLLGVFVLAKALVLWDRDLAWSRWTPLAYLWQDLLVVGIYAVFDWTIWPAWVSWAVYCAIVFYAAINVPVARVLSTPLTFPMLRAASGTLGDSIFFYLTWPNIFRMTSIIASAVFLAIALRGICLGPQAKAVALLIITCIVLLGPHASAQVGAFGLHRNAVIALVTTAIPRITGVDRAENWRVAPFEAGQSDDLSHLRGAARGRNVIIVHLESTGARYLGLYGATEDPMPNLRLLAEEAIIGENAYTVYPETIKSLVAVQCSIYPALETESKHYQYLQVPSLASELSRRGYRTGLFHSGRFRYLGMAEALHNRGFDTLEDAGHIGGNRESSFGIDEESTLCRMFAWMDERPWGQRFHISYLPIAGHHPYDTPTAGPFSEDQIIGRYRNALHYADRILGELVLGLRDRDLLANTLIVILGDHGEAFAQHQGNIGHSFFIFEENVRVPYVISMPGLTREAVWLRRVLSVVDTAPTVLDLLGMPRPDGYQGRSQLEPEHSMALFCTDYSQGLIGLRDNRWKFIHNLDTNRSELFDLESDPDERRNLASKYSTRVEAYRTHLLRWSENQKHMMSRSS
jgi:glucan phosphoethanolaminetransferase (alkaline phosphatase superfamily)